MEVWMEEIDVEEVKERKELCVERLREMTTEETVPELYQAYFRAQAKKLLDIFSYEEEVEQNRLMEMSAEECAARFDSLYAEILPENYKDSFSNPVYCAKQFGKRYGRLLCYVAAKINNQIFYAAEQNLLAVVMMAELFIEEYGSEEAFAE